jgi:phosphate transport system permease protein
MTAAPPTASATAAVAGIGRTDRAHRARVLAARRRVGAVMTLLVWIAAALVVSVLIAIFLHLVVGGLPAFGPSLFTELPATAGAGRGGLANGIVGTMLLLAFAALLGLPVGLGAGLYLAEHQTTRLATAVRFIADVLSGLPSIVLGIFAWELVVRPSGRFSALSGGFALGLLMIPLVTRATEEMVRLVPRALAESALALGFTRWRTSLAIVLRTAMPGIATAALVAMARAAGETAPLLFTAFGNAFWSLDPTRPIAALPLQIYAFAQSPYDDWRALAWAGALVLLLLVGGMNLLARAVLRARAALFAGSPARVATADD